MVEAKGSGPRISALHKQITSRRIHLDIRRIANPATAGKKGCPFPYQSAPPNSLLPGEESIFDPILLQALKSHPLHAK
jgi:hypothetical protein